MSMRTSDELHGSRQCYICLEATALPDDADWVSPCRCMGSMAWVHKRCVLRWVRLQDATSCPQCLTAYRITPSKGSLVMALEYIDKTIYPCLKISAAILMGTLAFDTACSALGIFALTMVYGIDESFRMLSTSSSVEVLSKLHLISYSLLIISAAPWEEVLLKALKCGATLPLLGRFLPTSTSHRAWIFTREPSVSRTVAGSVMLPIYARICGEVFFNDVPNKLTRVLLGGVSYLTIKGVIYMYYTQKHMVWLDQVTVLPYEPDPPSANEDPQRVDEPIEDQQRHLEIWQENEPRAVEEEPGEIEQESEQRNGQFIAHGNV